MHPLSLLEAFNGRHAGYRYCGDVAAHAYGQIKVQGV